METGPAARKAAGRQFLMCSGPVVLNETLWGLGTSMYPTVMGHMAGSTEILAAYTLAGNVEKICKVVSMDLPLPRRLSLAGRSVPDIRTGYMEWDSP